MPQLRAIPGSERAAPADMALTPSAGDEQVVLSVYLKPDDGHSTASARRASDPRAALATTREAAHAGDVTQLTAFAEANGLAVVEVDLARRLVKLGGSAAALAGAFGADLHETQSEGVSYRVRTGALHLPEPLAGRVIAVLGFDTRPVATPKIVPHRAGPPPQGFLPTEIAALYGFAGVQAADQCIGIIELGGGYTDADNQAAFGAMKLPVPPIVAVGVDGAANNPADTSGANGEVALDIQVAGGVAVGARIAVYFAPNTNQGFADAISQAVHDPVNKPSAISISWGSPESKWTGQAIAAMSAAFADAAALGVTVTAASGDALATDGVKDGKAHVDYPASDPKVLGCGGTLVAASAGALTGETVWKSNGGGTGGGVSALFARPAYQRGLTIPKRTGRKGGRGVPDVAGNADPDSGYRIVTGGKVGIIGGTSAVAPLWAAIAAVLNAHRDAPLGQPHAALYAARDGFHDVMDGDNKAGAVGYPAAPGWDPCTGLGSPNGPALLAALGDGAKGRV